MAKTEKKIRVHNQGKREYTIPPAKDGKKKRMIQPGRAIEIEEKLDKKMINAYPQDLVEFDSLVSGEKKNLSKENARLESENSTYLEKIASLEEEVQTLVDNIPPTDKDISEENQELKNKIIELEQELGDPNERVPGGFQKSRVKELTKENQELRDKIDGLPKLEDTKLEQEA